MRLNSLLISLLALSTLLNEAQGIRLGKVSLSSSTPNNEIQEKGSLVKASVKGGTAAEEAGKGAENDCSSAGKIKKHTGLKTTSSTTTTTTTTKTHEKKVDPTLEAKPNSSEEGLSGKEENLSVNTTPVTKHGEVSPEQYPDIVDIAGMDYSPARRKPPIHN